MPVVSNTSPILNLSIVGQLGILRKEFGQIVIPPAVRRELRLEDNVPGCKVIREHLDQGWIVVEKPRNRSLIRILRRQLDEGESQAIALAKQVNADRILLDEREARRIAKSLELKVTGVLGVLLRSSLFGDSDSFKKILQDLQEQAGFWISDRLVRELMNEVGGDTDPP